MTKISTYHNPDCSKSRATLSLLEKNDVSPEIIYSIETSPDIADLKSSLGTIALPLHLLQRNIVIKNGQAVIARPPENILRLIGE